MKLGFIGLGRMGLDMVTRLVSSGEHEVAVWNRSPGPVREASERGAIEARSIEDLVKKLHWPRAVWVMVTAGDPVDEVIEKTLPYLEKDDSIIDGGNSNYKDSVRRAAALASRGVRFLDAGTSGGVWGRKEGYCIMVGGEKEVFTRMEPVFKTLAGTGGYSHVGPSGAGHFVKMIHNGIEYGLLQAYAEGFSLLKASDYDLDLAGISRLWNRGSVIRSWLLELSEKAFSADPGLENIKGYVEDSGEGRWTVLESLDKGIACPVITLSLLNRFQSRDENPFAARLVAALRREFGGHRVKK